MARKLQPDGTCTCCGRVGPVWEDCLGPDDTPPLCDTCDYAQRRWDAATAGGWYPFADAPPKSPPVRHR